MGTEPQRTAARKVTPLPAASVQRSLVREKRDGERTDENVRPAVQEVLDSPGRPLDAAPRAEMESRFGHDFSRVRVHTDERAAASAATVDALAYTVGQNIVFGAGQYAPPSAEGSKLLAHELTHTIQQGAQAEAHSGALPVTDPQSAVEREADEAAEAATAGNEEPAIAPAGAGIARTPAPPPPTKKKVTVNVTNVSGSTATIGSAITYSNTNVYNQANVEIEKGKEITLTDAQSKADIGNDLIVQEYKSPDKPTPEEKALLKENQTAGVITVYFVKGLSDGSLGESFWASSGSGLTGVIVGGTRSDNTFAHELGHVLLDDGGHTVPDSTYLMHATAVNPTKLTPEQITKIQSSPFVK
jgi:hypothetical protein